MCFVSMRCVPVHRVCVCVCVCVCHGLSASRPWPWVDGMVDEDIHPSTHVWGKIQVMYLRVVPHGNRFN